MGMAFTALLLLACAQEQALIDFKTDVTRVPNVVKQLSQATGLKLSAGSSLTDEIVCVIAEKKPQKEILDELAFALDAAWVKHGDSYTLDRPTHWPITFRERRAAAAAKSIQACLDRVPRAKELSVEELLAEAARERKERDETEQMSIERMMNFGTKTPAGVLLDSIIAEMTPAGIGRFADERTVLSNRPNKVQVALPKKLEAAIAKFAETHNRAVPAMEESIKSNKHSWGMSANPLDSWGPVDSATLKLLVVVDIARENSLTLKVLQDNKVAAVAYRYLNAPGTKPLSTSPTLVPLQERSVSFLKNRKFLDPTQEAVLADQTLLKQLFEATDLDLLTPVNTEAMQAIQVREGRALVAVIPDVMIAQPWLMDAKGNLNLNLYDSLRSYAKFGTETHNGWVVLRSESPEARFSRTKLTRTLSQARTEGRMSLDNWSRASLEASGTDLRLYSQICSMFGFPPSREWAQAPNVIRFYGLLTSDQKEVLQRGDSLTADGLTKSQTALVQAALFQGDNFMTIQKSAIRTLAFDLERTEIYPEGFTDPCQITAEFNGGELFFVAYESDGVKRTTRADPNSLAWGEVHIERPDLFPSQGQAPRSFKSAAFFKGREIRYDFVFRGNEAYDFGAEAADQVVDRSKPLTWSQLPASMREEFEKAKKALIERYTKLKQEGRLGTGNGKVPPP